MRLVDRGSGGPLTNFLSGRTRSLRPDSDQNPVSQTGILKEVAIL